MEDAEGATEEDISDVTQNADNLEAIMEFNAESKKFMAANKKLWNVIHFGNRGDEVAPMPAPPVLTLPYLPDRTGLNPLAHIRNLRFKAASGYTKEIGEALGIREVKGEK